jgi:hypothetical protein
LELARTFIIDIVAFSVLACSGHEIIPHSRVRDNIYIRMVDKMKGKGHLCTAKYLSAIAMIRME